MSTTDTTLYRLLHFVTRQPAVRCGAGQRKELERLCRYITRPAIAVERLKRTGGGDVVLQLKSAFRDGTTHIVMSPLHGRGAFVTVNEHLRIYYR